MSLFMKGDDDMEQQHLAIASVPMQNWETLYDWDQALATGTIFPGLNKPFFVSLSRTKMRHPSSRKENV